MKPIKQDGKRQEILEAASRTFLRDGLQGASISAICVEAQISPGHLYYYFDDKEAIVEAIAQAYLADVQEHFGKLAKSASVVSIIVSEIEGAIEFSRTGKQAFLFELLAEASRNPEMAKILRGKAKLMQSLLADLIRKGQESGEVDAHLDPEIAGSVILNVIDAAKMMCTRSAGIDVTKSIKTMSTMTTRFLSSGRISKARRKRSAV